MNPAVVALGGGHGLYSSLLALRTLTTRLTAIVTVSDDGGSSGRLREEFDCLPPGDLRMALSALCEDTEWGRTWRDVLQMRYESAGPLNGHAVGNLLITALWEHTGDVVDGLKWVAELLRSHGQVLPLAAEPIVISATVNCDGVDHQVDGQVAVATAPGRITQVSLNPSHPRVPVETIEALDAADVIVLGPGSWYSSVLPHFLVPQVAAALLRNQHKTVVILNIADEDEETAGTTRVDDVAALRAVAPDFVARAVLADSSHGFEDQLCDALAAWGVPLHVADLRLADTVDRHDPVLLAASCQQIFSGLRQENIPG